MEFLQAHFALCDIVVVVTVAHAVECRVDCLVMISGDIVPRQEKSGDV
jgi:hypothetical protein